MSAPGRPGPLAGRTVLVPGTAETAAGALTALRGAGATALVVPLIETVAPPDTGPIDRAMRSLAAGGYQWLAVTSAAAVRVLDDRLHAAPAWGKAGSLAELLATGRVRCAAVGPGTARALAARGVEPLVPVHGTGAFALVGPLAAAARGNRVLFARGDLAGTALIGGLRGSGVIVDDVVAYLTTRADEPGPDVVAAWSQGRVDAVLLTSPSTAQAVLDRLGEPSPGTMVACIGPTTAQAANELGLTVHVVSPAPTTSALVDAVAAALGPATS